MALGMSDIPPSHRFITAISVGFFFADSETLKCHTDDWLETRAAASWVFGKSDRFVAFRRFVYDPEHGKEYMDPGWVYFRGVLIPRDDILSGKVLENHPDFEVSDILKSNVRNNRCDVVWFKDDDMKYPLYEEDTFVNLSA